MSALAIFLRALLNDGQAILRPPLPGPRQPDPKAVAVLAEAFACHHREVAGPRVPFDALIGLGAAEIVYRAAWFLVDHSLPPHVLQEVLTLPRPTTPSQHLSADVTLRFIIYLHRRARAHDPADVLTARLAELLRIWPLVGVLSDVEDVPLTAPDFAGHPGLQLLYAERWCTRSKRAWLPPPGPGWERLELVWSELGKAPAVLQAMLQTSLPLEQGNPP